MCFNSQKHNKFTVNICFSEIAHKFNVLLSLHTKKNTLTINRGHCSCANTLSTDRINVKFELMSAKLAQVISQHFVYMNGNRTVKILIFIFNSPLQHL